MEGFTVYDHVPECCVTFGRGRLHNVWWNPHIDHRTSWGTIPNVPWYIPAREAYMEVTPLSDNTFIRGASPGITYEMWDRHTIGWQRWYVATQERKVCDMEVEIVTFCREGKCAADRPSRSTVDPRRKQSYFSQSCILSQAQRDTSYQYNSQNLDYWLTIRHRCIDMWSWTERLFTSRRKQRLYEFRFV